MRPFPVILLLVGLGVTAARAEPERLSNRESLARTYSKLQRIARGEIEQLRIGIVGDSVANSKPKFLVPKFGDEFGYLAFHQPPLSASVTFFGDAQGAHGTPTFPYDHTFSWTGSYYYASPGGAFNLHVWDAGVHCNRVVLYFETGPDRGSFKLQRSTETTVNHNWVDQSGFELVNTYSATRGWMKIVLDLPLARHALRVEHVSGGRVVLPMFPIYQNTLQSGVTTYQVRRGGLGLDKANTWDQDFAADFLAELDLDLCFFEMKESPSWYAKGLEDFGRIFFGAMPDCEWVFILSSPIGPGHDPTLTKQVIENEILQEFGVRNGFFVFDGYSLIGSYARMEELGWQGDTVHEAPAASEFLANELWKEMGFLVAPRLGLRVSDTPVVDETTPDEQKLPASRSASTRQLTIANIGTTTSGNLSVQITGNETAGFSAIASRPSLLPGQTLSLAVQYQPTNYGTARAEIEVQTANNQSTALKIPIFASTAEGLQRWVATHFPEAPLGDSDFQRDSDADQLPDVVEYVLGTNPKLPTASAPAIEATEDALRIMFSRSKEAILDGYEIIPEMSTSLAPGSWIPILQELEVLSTTDTTESVGTMLSTTLDTPVFIRLRLRWP